MSCEYIKYDIHVIDEYKTARSRFGIRLYLLLNKVNYYL